MALMKFREPNQVRWIGSRPGHNGTQILEDARANNSAIRIYTTPADVTFFLCSLVLNLESVVAGVAYCRVYDDGGAAQYYIFERTVLAADPTMTIPFSFWPPMELPTDWSVRVGSNIAGLILRGDIFGWIE